MSQTKNGIQSMSTANERNQSTAIDHYRMFIDGEFRDAVSGETIDVASPTTEEVLYTVPKGNASRCHLALETAQAAQTAWAATPAVERGEILAKFAEPDPREP